MAKTSENRDSESEKEIRANAVALSAVRDLPEAAAGLVHEVKNPLAAIHLHLQLLENHMQQVKDSELREKLLGRAAIIKREIVSLNQTLHTFLSMFRAERKEKQIGNLNSVVREIVELLAPQAEQESIALELNEGDVSQSVVFDPTFVKQIAVNLILNSVQAITSAKSTRREIRVETGMEDSRPYLRVSDSGPGIAPEQQAKIFEPFYSTKKEGSGLGLALAQKMTGEMGGEIRVDSTPGTGAVFTVVLGKQGYI